MKNIIPVIVGIIFLSFRPSFAQTQFEVNVKQIIEDPAKGRSYLNGYVQPLTNSFATLTASGLFHRASVKSFPKFDLGLTYLSTPVPETANTFLYQDLVVPTVFGDNAAAEGVISGTGLTSLQIPLLQLNLGLSEDFELMLRTCLAYTIPELGEIRLSGVGIKYGLSDLVTLPTFPIDLSVQASYHLLSMNSWFKAGTFAMNIQSSKEFTSFPLEFFTGLGYEVSSVTMLTDNIPGIGGPGLGDVKENGANGLRLVLGISLNLPFFTLSADYEFGFFDAIALGAKIAL